MHNVTRQNKYPASTVKSTKANRGGFKEILGGDEAGRVSSVTVGTRLQSSIIYSYLASCATIFLSPPARKSTKSGW